LLQQPENADVLYNVGVALRQQGKDDEAAAAYRRTISLRPDYTETHYNLGNVLLTGGQLDDAVQSYEQALRCKPDHADARRNLRAALQAQAVARLNVANALRDKGRNEEAEREYRTTLRSDPGLLPARIKDHYMGIAAALANNIDRLGESSAHSRISGAASLFAPVKAPRRCCIHTPSAAMSRPKSAAEKRRRA
jgi:tetratricopeptide (TPR) repeat protein